MVSRSKTPMSAHGCYVRMLDVCMTLAYTCVCMLTGWGPMKGSFPDQVLSTIGLDSNNGISPLAYAIVEFENTSSWKQILENLGNDLEIGTNSNFTFITDKQNVFHIYLRIFIVCFNYC